MYSKVQIERRIWIRVNIFVLDDDDDDDDYYYCY